MIVRLVFAGLIAGVFLITTAIGSPTGSGIFSDARGEMGVQEVREVRAEKGRGGESDPNIKSDSDANDPRSRPEAPESKGGSRARGQLAPCQVVIDNWTGWYVRVYVDGTYRGTIAPWDAASCTTGAGRTQVYALATFTDGSRFTWGPSEFKCATSFTWKLRP